LVYADEVYMLDGNIHTIIKNTDALLVGSMEIGVGWRPSIGLIWLRIGRGDRHL
jgi:hypothetical protein